MKKAIALLATLVVLTSTTFAQLAPSISGFAETKVGTNLTTDATGIELDSEVTVTVPLFTGEASTEGEGATGSASITGSSLTFTLGLDAFDDDDDFLTDDLNDEDSVLKGTDVEISAKIDFANGAYITIGSGSDLEANFVDGDKDYWVKPSFDEEEALSLGFAKDTFSAEITFANELENGGFATEEEDNATDEGYRGDTDVIAEDKIVDVDEVGVDDTLAKVGGIFFGGKAMYTAGDIFTLDVAFATSETAAKKADKDKKTAFAAKVTTTPMEGLTLTVPFDYLSADAGTAMELLPTVSYTTGALTLGADFHYISVAKEFDPGFTTDATKNATVVAGAKNGVAVAFIPAGYDQSITTIDGVDYITKSNSGVLEIAEDVDGYVPADDARDNVDALKKDYIGQKLNATIGYALDAGVVSLTVGSSLSEMDSDMDLTVKGSFTAPTWSVAFDLDNVMAKAADAKDAVNEDLTTLRIEKADAEKATSAGMDDIGLDATYSGVTGVSVSLETTLSLDDARDNSEAFTLDSLNIDFDSAITGLENTVITVNFSEFDGADAKGIFYVGAKISL